MQRQLSIFDSLQPLDIPQVSLRPGDWVKLRRKTPHAAHWKKGEIVQIESVHPVNGCGRFWNERANDWGYLYPDDVTVTLPPRDSVSPGAIEQSVTELEPQPTVTELAVTPVVTELEPAPGAIEQSVTGPVSTYWPRGTAGRGEYFRFSYRAGTKVKHKHIPGGNTGSILAQSRAAEVMELSAAGVPALEICEHIKRWSTRARCPTW
ncbi:nuclear transport factor 2 family protein [Microcoleus sp. CZ3-B4]|uniref:nuclear transport factor 2 family protein n=1 Tax=Microcoleus sp. CZ3-B4 TaxID=2818733 RepID=UPI002FD35DD4